MVVVIAVATIANNGRPTQGQGREVEITKKDRTNMEYHRLLQILQTVRGGGESQVGTGRVP